MADEITTLPYDKLSDLKIRNDEPMTYAYFNAHMLRLLQDIRSINRTTTLQHATTTQWGVVKFATVDDVISEGGNRDTVLTNRVLAESVDTMRKRNEKAYRDTGKLPLSKNYEWVHGEFSVGLGENMARRVTDSPDRVVYYSLYFVPLNYGDRPFRTASSVHGVDGKYFKEGLETCGFVNFDTVETPKEYEEFHVYYHRSGYVVCRNGRFQDGQGQIKVVWNLLMRK